MPRPSTITKTTTPSTSATTITTSYTMMIFVIVMNNIRIMTGCAFVFFFMVLSLLEFICWCLSAFVACLLACLLPCLLACLFVSWFVQWSVHACDPHPESSEPK